MIQTILINIFTIFSVAFAVVLTYSLRSTKGDFVFIQWIKTNSNRFLAGGVLTVLISILIVTSPDIDALFKVIGFDTSKSPVSIGLALGALLVAAFSGVKPAEKPE